MRRFAALHDASHHTIGHNLTHLIAGGVVLWVAWAGTSGTRRWFCFAFGAAYLAIGFFGFFSVRDALRLIPGILEFHLEDHWVQIGTGLLFVVLGLLKKLPDRNEQGAGSDVALPFLGKAETLKN